MYPTRWLLLLPLRTARAASRFYLFFAAQAAETNDSVQWAEVDGSGYEHEYPQADATNKNKDTRAGRAQVEAQHDQYKTQNDTDDTISIPNITIHHDCFLQLQMTVLA